MKCKMCPQQYGRGSFNAEIPLDVYKRLIDECCELGLEVAQLDGSGEATLLNNLPEYIQYAHNKGLKVQIYSNGILMDGDYMKECVDAGLSLFRFSVNGYDRDSYKNVTGYDFFDRVVKNAKEMKDYINSSNSDCILASYHLVFKSTNEIDLYRKNFIDIVDSSAEIWKPHNWSGELPDIYRHGKKRSCGRPTSPEITIRAGGIDGHTLAVVPCCQTLGRDEIAVLGHCDDTSVADVYNSEKYNALRKLHIEERFDESVICKDCDFLYDDESVLLWTNKETGNMHKMNGLNFNLIK